MERNLLISISFDGAQFHGWQIQENAYTAQEAFQKALYSIIGTAVDIKACSRTDSGVHARMFCISVKIFNPITTASLKSALNHFLPSSMAALEVKEVPSDFHARYSCLGKEYVYEIWNHQVRDPFLQNRALHYWYPIDEEKLSLAASHYIGAHDFSSFCTMDSRKIGDMVRTVRDARVERQGDMVRFIVSADGFLYNMVRIMTGTLLRVQERKIQPQDIPKIISARSRKLAGPTAPPQGLYLNRVFY